MAEELTLGGKGLLDACFGWIGLCSPGLLRAVRVRTFNHPLMLVLPAIFVMLFLSAPAFANTGMTGESTWVNGDADPVATNQFASDATLGCPATINLWATNMPASGAPPYFHVNAIAPTADPFVHASGMYTVAAAGSSTPERIATIDVGKLIQSARDTDQPHDPNGHGYHYRLVFDSLTSTVDFWVNCAGTAPDPSPTPDPSPPRLKSLKVPNPCKWSVGRMDSKLDTRLKRRWMIYHTDAGRSCEYQAHNPNRYVSTDVPSVFLLAHAPESRDSFSYWWAKRGKGGYRWTHDHGAGHDGYWTYIRDRRPGLKQNLFEGYCIPHSADPHTRVDEAIIIQSKLNRRDAHLKFWRMHRLFRFICDHS